MLPSSAEEKAARDRQTERPSIGPEWGRKGRYVEYQRGEKKNNIHSHNGANP